MAAVSGLPLSGTNAGNIFFVEGQPTPPPGQAPVGVYRVVTPGYFDAMEIPLLKGRDFTDADNAKSPRVIIIDAAIAKKHFAGKNPIGMHIQWEPTPSAKPFQIVGVAGDVKHYGLDQDNRPGFYLPHAQRRDASLAIVARTAGGDPLGTIAAARRILRELDATLPLSQPLAMDDIIQRSFWNRVFICRLFDAFSALALALAAIGIAGVMAYSVTQRAREIGLRMALGAQPGDVLRMVMSQGMRLTGIGLAVGVGASLGFARALASQLYGVGVIDPISLGTSVAIFGAVALVACYLPARRATKVDPMTALRAE